MREPELRDVLFCFPVEMPLIIIIIIIIYTKTVLLLISES